MLTIWEEAGVLSLAALTAYRALFTRRKLKPGQTVLIPEIGSGVAINLLIMAKAAGARVIGTSRSEIKCAQALERGADLTLLSDSDWKKELQGENVDLIIDSVGPATWERAVSVLRVGGTLVNFGATTGFEIKMDLRNLYFGQINILGSTMGSTEEYKEMLQFIERYQIRPVIDKVYQHADTLEALKRMSEGVQFGKIDLIIER
ncbi:zinc-binding dehydrogenase [Neobacillus niacini]|uniref:zinc-binding dehydrogenase n=1 Tax=Neobacillus niacini TaxID=86668 RepID=UPI002FFEE4AB